MAIRVYTDGSCLGNPGPGGWAALVIFPELEGKAKPENTFELQGGEAYTTNNRMEMLAVIKAFEFMQEKLSQSEKAEMIHVYSDSSLVINTMTKAWKKKKNVDLWERLSQVSENLHTTWHWVKGHAGHPENENCDKRALAEANAQMKNFLRLKPEEKVLPGDAPTLF